METTEKVRLHQSYFTLTVFPWSITVAFLYPEFDRYTEPCATGSLLPTLASLLAAVEIYYTEKVKVNNRAKLRGSKLTDRPASPR